MRNLSAFALASFLAVSAAIPAHAAYAIYVYQDGPNLVVSGSGTIDTAVGYSGGPTVCGQTYLTSLGFCDGNGGPGIPITGPANIGPGTLVVPPAATSSTGDFIALLTSPKSLAVPFGYTSGTELSQTATWDNANLIDFGVTPGIYTWTWGSGADADSASMYVGFAPPPSTTPEPASLGLLAAGVLAVALISALRLPKSAQLR